MERFSTCELREKEVINLCDGTRLGYPADFEFNVFDGSISAIVIKRFGGFLGFGRGNDIVIPWKNIECIGTDAILVRMTVDDEVIFFKGRSKKR